MEIKLHVASYCDEFGRWNWEQIEQELPRQISLMIVVVMVDPTNTEDDVFCWLPMSNGEFTVKLAYELQSKNLYSKENH